MSTFSRFKNQGAYGLSYLFEFEQFQWVCIDNGFSGIQGGLAPLLWNGLPFCCIDDAFVFGVFAIQCKAHDLFDKYRNKLLALNTGGMYIDEEPKSIGDAQYMVVGYGGIGRPAYHYLKDELGLKTIAIDYNHVSSEKYKTNGIQHQLGDSSNSIFGILTLSWSF